MTTDEPGTHTLVRGARSWHVAREKTEAGYFTICRQPVGVLSAEVVEGVPLADLEALVTCATCRARLKLGDAPRRSYGRPAHRLSHDPARHLAETTQLAHKEVVAGLEWLERGQAPTALDRIHLAYRFLAEVLIKNGRIAPPISPEDEEP